MNLLDYVRIVLSQGSVKLAPSHIFSFDEPHSGECPTSVMKVKNLDDNDPSFRVFHDRRTMQGRDAT